MILKSITYDVLVYTETKVSIITSAQFRRRSADKKRGDATYEPWPLMSH